jgi:plastocyanin
MRIGKRRAVGAMVVAVVALVGTASVAGAAAPPKFQTTVNDIFLPGGGIQFVVEPAPTVVPAGTYKVGFANNSVAPHVLVAVGGLPAAIDTVPEFIALIDAVNAGAPPPEGSFEAGAVFSKPGQDHQKLFDNTVPGQYGFFCPIVSPDGTPHYKEGFVGLFNVVPAS